MTEDLEAGGVTVTGRTVLETGCGVLVSATGGGVRPGAGQEWHRRLPPVTLSTDWASAESPEY